MNHAEHVGGTYQNNFRTVTALHKFEPEAKNWKVRYGPDI